MFAINYMRHIGINIRIQKISHTFVCNILRTNYGNNFERIRHLSCSNFNISYRVLDLKKNETTF